MTSDEGNTTDLHPYGPGSHRVLDDVQQMPGCYPIKGNVRDDGSTLYHRPDSQDYEATTPEVWFDSPSAAEAAGFVLAPTHPDDGDGSTFEPGGSQHPCSAAEVESNRDAVLSSVEEAVGYEVIEGRSRAAAYGGSAGAALVGGTVLDFERHPYGVGSHRVLGKSGDRPDYYLIKGNTARGDRLYYHRPDSAEYERTDAEVWFDSPSAAEAAGFVLAPSHPDDGVAADYEPGGSGHPWSFEEVEAERRAATLRGQDAAGGVDAGEDADSDTVDEASDTGPETEEVGSDDESAAIAASGNGDGAGLGKMASAGAVGAGLGAVAAAGADKAADSAGTAASAGGKVVEKAGSALAGATVGEAVADTHSQVTGGRDPGTNGPDGEPATADRGGLGRWFWWAIGAVALLLLLALLVAQCGDDDDAAVGSGDAQEESGDGSAPAGATAEEDGDADADAGSDLEAAALAGLAAAGFDDVEVEVDGDQVRLVGAVGSADDRAAAEAAVAGVDGVGSVDNALSVESADADGAAEAGDTDTDAGDAEAGSDLEPAALAALAAAGFDDVEVEVDGDRLRLVGAVGSADDRAAAEAAVAGVDGVGSVDNALLVEEAPAADAVDSDPDFTG